MARFATVFTFTLLAFACAALAADDKDPIRDRLVAAKTAYDAEMEDVRKQATIWLDRREELAKKNADKKLLEQVKAERKALDDGTVPKSVAVLKPRQDKARTAMDAAYADAVQAYTKAKKTDEASSVTAAWKAFQEAHGLTAEGPLDLLSLVDPKAHAVLGQWRMDAKSSLIGVNPRFPAVFQLPYEPGEEYDLEATARRLSGEEYFGFQIVAGGKRLGVSIDTWPSKGYLSGLGAIDGKSLVDNGTGVKGQFITNNKDFTVRCSVRSGKIDVSFDGKVITSYKGEFNRFSIHSDFRVPNENALALQIGYTSPFKIDRLVVTPVKGKGTIVK